MKITVLTFIESEEQKKYDLVVGQVVKALKQWEEHKVSILAVHGDVNKLRTGLLRRKPDLVFNLMETFGSNQLGAVGIVGLLDLLGVPYTGGGPGEFLHPRGLRVSPRNYSHLTVSNIPNLLFSPRTLTLKLAAICTCRFL